MPNEMSIGTIGGICVLKTWNANREEEGKRERGRKREERRRERKRKEKERRRKGKRKRRKEGNKGIEETDWTLID